MPGCDRKEYESYSAKHFGLHEEICGRLGEGDRGLLAKFDFTGEALASFDPDNAYIQGFAMGWFLWGCLRRCSHILTG